MKILLLGSKGMLGSDCRKVLAQEYEIVTPEKKELDIVSWDKVIDKMHHIKPNIVLNCAALTDMDAHEGPKELFTLRKMNVEGPRNLAQGSARYNCKIIHISCDCVFSGQKLHPQPYFEDDPMEPISGYGRSKMESEIAVKDNAPNYLIIRTGWLYGLQGKDFMKSLLGNASDRKKTQHLKIASDRFGSPTWSYRLAEQIRELIRVDAGGTYHATSEGYCSLFDSIAYVVKRLNLAVSLEPCSVKAFPQRAKRPNNAILENRLLKKYGLNIMGEWQDDLDAFLQQSGDEWLESTKPT